MGETVAVGAVWLVLTLTFEIAFGRYVVRAPCSRIVSDYDLLQGGLLPIGLAVLTVRPLSRPGCDACCEIPRRSSAHAPGPLERR
jgi:hypothetical protein